MSAGFSPGPWHFKRSHERHPRFGIFTLGNIILARTWRAEEANLIAAAPDLYEALASAYNIMGTTTDCLNSGEPSRHRYAEQRIQREMDRVRSALRKAQGLAEASGDAS